MLIGQVGAMGRGSDLSGAGRSSPIDGSQGPNDLASEHKVNKNHLLLFSLVFAHHIASSVYFLRRKTLYQICLLQPRRRDAAAPAPWRRSTISPNNPALPEIMAFRVLIMWNNYYRTQPVPNSPSLTTKYWSFLSRVARALPSYRQKEEGRVRNVRI